MAWDLEVEITISRPRDHLPAAAESFWNTANAQTPEMVPAGKPAPEEQDRVMSPG
jgi:hypothetical protein